jgi:hypothetical protein
MKAHFVKKGRVIVRKLWNVFGTTFTARSGHRWQNGEAFLLDYIHNYASIDNALLSVGGYVTQ